MWSYKKIILQLFYIVAVLVSYSSYAQIVTTFSGVGTMGYSGDGGPATAAQHNTPRGLAINTFGDVFIAEVNGRVRKVNSAGIITTVAGGGASTADGVPATSAYLNGPYGIATDGAGNVYIAVRGLGDHRIRKVNGAGIITTIAGTGTSGFFGDGGAASSAILFNPDDVCVDTYGNIYIADTWNDRIRKIDLSGTITTVAGTTHGFAGEGTAATLAQLAYPEGVSVDGAGNIYIIDGGNQRVRKVNPSGIITTIAGTGIAGYFGDGGAATLAKINNPKRVCVDAAGNVYFSDRSNYVVRKINTAGIISTIAGTGVTGYAGDNCSADSAQFAAPYGIVISAGNIYVADENNQRVRMISAGHAPYFVDGHIQNLTVCHSGTAILIDTLTEIFDLDIGQQETWSVVALPMHGTLTAAYTATSTGGILASSGVSYTATSGYIGNDTFKIMVADCDNVSDTTTVYVTVANCTLNTPPTSVACGLLGIYPNPNNGSFTINISSVSDETAQIRITDIVGTTIKELVAPTNTSTDASIQLSQGVYFIYATTPSGKWSSKIVISNSLKN